MEAVVYLVSPTSELMQILIGYTTRSLSSEIGAIKCDALFCFIPK